MNRLSFTHGVSMVLNHKVKMMWTHEYSISHSDTLVINNIEQLSGMKVWGALGVYQGYSGHGSVQDTHVLQLRAAF